MLIARSSAFAGCQMPVAGRCISLSISTPPSLCPACPRGIRIEVHDPRGPAFSRRSVAQRRQSDPPFLPGPARWYLRCSGPALRRVPPHFAKRWFYALVGLVEIRSEIPVRTKITLDVAPVTTKVEVNDSATLVDPYTSASQYSIGRQNDQRESFRPSPAESLLISSTISRIGSMKPTVSFIPAARSTTSNMS